MRSVLETLYYCLVSVSLSKEISRALFNLNLYLYTFISSPSEWVVLVLI